jgi:hypothetical protein
MPPIKPAESKVPAIVSKFLRERTTPDPSCELYSRAIYSAFYQWEEAKRHPPLTKIAFGKALTAAGLRKRRMNGTIYIGVRLR